MDTMTFCVPCLFGLEGLVGDELRRLDLQNVRVEDRRVFFEGDFAAMAKANLCCRMGERVMILLAEFDAHSFEDLFQGVKAVPLERFIPKDGAFPVKGYSLNSQLHSVPDCQAIVKKAAVTRLGEKYGLGWMPETGETYQLRFSIMKDHVELFLDTSGVSLHKRGYRREANLAPLHETMAAAMVNLARYRGRDFFWDPFCGSGTICIEAAMIALNRAPGLNRSFMAQKWACVPETVWQRARTEALDCEYRGEYHILGSDIDAASLKQLMERLDTLNPGDTLVLAGSIPASMPEDSYSRILEMLKERGVLFAVDATGDLLMNVLPYRPFLIKPNNHELGELFHVTLKTREEVVPYAKKLQEMGAQNVLVSMAGQGAVLLDAEGCVHMLPAPRGTLVNAVGAGDSMVAGFLAGYMEEHDYAKAFYMGLCAGSASAFSEELATRDEVLALMHSIGR